VTGLFAAAAVRSSGVVDLQDPFRFAVGNTVSDQMLLGRSVDLVTGPAGPAPFFLVDMDIVQVSITVAEIGQGGGLFGGDDLGVMTGKTESVVFGIKGCVKLGRILRDEETEDFTPVGGVAGTAIL